MTHHTKISLSPCLLVTLSFILAGCSYTNPLNRAYDTNRPDYGTNALPNPGPDAPVSHIHIINGEPTSDNPASIETAITGTWTFTAPPTTTTMERKTADMHQFSIYQGRPAPTDTPFLVITVTADPRSVTASDPDTYKITSTRTYTLNGNIAKESTGHTNTGSAFSELILSHPGSTGDQCHAVAIAKTNDQRKEALDILGSIVWKATTASNP